LGSYDTQGMTPKGVTVVPGNKAIIVGTGAEEYQVINLANESSPTRCGGLNIDSGVNGVSSVLESDNDAYSYIITGDTSTELKIIEGGPGGRFANNGTYESAIFDAGFNTAFNRIYSQINMPSQTDVKLQLAVADAVNGSCSGASFTYIGPDPNDPTNSYFTASGGIIQRAIPYINVASYKNPGRCFRYKAYLSTTDAAMTPSFYDITINYSP